MRPRRPGHLKGVAQFQFDRYCVLCERQGNLEAALPEWVKAHILIRTLCRLMVGEQHEIAIYWPRIPLTYGNAVDVPVAGRQAELEYAARVRSQIVYFVLAIENEIELHALSAGTVERDSAPEPLRAARWGGQIEGIGSPAEADVAVE